MEGNPGFCMFVKLTTGAQLTFNAIDLRNVWMEENATPQFNRALDGSAAPPSPSKAGTVKGLWNPVQKKLSFEMDFNLTSTANGAALWSGAPGSGTFIQNLPNFPTTPTTYRTGGANAIPLNSTLEADLFAHNLYIQITTTTPGDTVEAHLTITPLLVTIDSTDYTARELRFEGVRSVSIYETLIKDIELIGSSVNLYNCKSDTSYIESNNWPYRVDVDPASALVAQELRYGAETPFHTTVRVISRIA